MERQISKELLRHVGESTGTFFEPQEFVEAREILKVAEGEINLDLFRFTPTQQQLEAVDENSNPILCFFKLRPEKIIMESVYYE